MTDQEIRLHFGEMTGQEMRTAKSIVGYYERKIINVLEDNRDLADGDQCTLFKLKELVTYWD